MEDDRRPSEGAQPPLDQPQPPVPPAPQLTPSQAPLSRIAPSARPVTSPEPPPPVAWEAPPADAGSGQVADASDASRLDVPSILARTIDTFLANWLTFVVLSLPGVAATLIYYWLPTTVSRIPALSLLFLLLIPIGIFVPISITIAADVARRGGRATASEAAGSAVTPTFIALLSGVVVVLVVVGLAVMPTLLLAVARGPVGIVGVIAFILAIAIILYILLRWALAPTAIALEGAGPITALSRSWQVTEGNLWRLGVLVVAVGLLGLPWSFAASLFLIGGNLPAAIAIGVVGTLLFGSLPPIVVTLAYGDLTGRPRGIVAPPQGEPQPDFSTGMPPAVEPVAGSGLLAQPVPVEGGLTPAAAPVQAPPAAQELSTTPGLRWTYVLGVLLVGVVLLVPAVVLGVPRLGALALGAVPPEDRGNLYFGTDRNPVNPCAPLGRATTFSTSDPIYIGGYFSRPILPGQSASLHVYSGGQEIVDESIEAGVRAVACYYEPEPLVGAPVGAYRIVIDDAGGTLAEGTFTVE
jgi:hypothetical protein